MDGRLVRSCLLLMVAAGCQRQMVSVPGSVPVQSPPIDVSQIKKAPPKDLPPNVLVSAGDFKAGEALSPNATPDQQQMMRDLARQDYEKALKKDPKYVPAYQGLGRLYVAMQEHERAAEAYQQALRIDGKNASLWYELGMCHHRRKNWPAALECLDRAAALDPHNRSYVQAKAIVLAEAGRYDDSLNCFVRSDGEAMGYFRLAQTLQRLQQPELSRQYLAVALHKDPSLAATLAPPSAVASNAPNPSVQQTAYPPANDASPAVVPAATPMPAPHPLTPTLSPSRGRGQGEGAPQFLPPPPPSVSE
jgi:tetratricopeptide (TPR) repeat protein